MNYDIFIPLDTGYEPFLIASFEFKKDAQKYLENLIKQGYENPYIKEKGNEAKRLEGIS